MHGRATITLSSGANMTYSPLHRLRAALRASRVAQVTVVVLFWLGGCEVAAVAGVPVPGSLIGLLALLLVLSCGLMEPRLIERGASWLLAQMLLFFVPAVVALMAHPEFLGLAGLKVLLVILGSTLLVMLATGLTVDLGMRWMSHRARAVTVLE
jgi:holin-like protein